MHFAVGYFTEVVVLVLGTYSDKIDAAVIVVPLCSGSWYAVFVMEFFRLVHWHRVLIV